ncbi:2-amino-4-hydroxy-6-hydroxymethyldihydropteridine diphosphokinase [Pseudoclostridium thermosuccinogenes]|jgi:2-amino-4-hydroxy-6-hydroxymethyldihydropteridine diphosphokinase|uniref:2-amino-4-hydroxy-6- hydroxymethyldihydropteridine diphosphokinase n=1 Tax=Clostridium thermosuccinogenes TaxID=84032 RepID=UPI000CCC1673|nr:2-amino-4-hydroxy-6-hydroxymethyldihydropteridine diphosphokinase [Pseudoclostridium thermosuccinogenes]PNT91497.1 2-amino-4-hydroxy-6-hydroxymethyldihydropteridine diphosphokinase [Pseudoclostridium thermosuccinogenes]
MAHKAYIALGSNLGDREGHLTGALQYISGITGTRILSISNIYETDPVGYTEQGKFLNMVVLVGTSLSPLRLLDELQKMEQEFKRSREIRWGPRTLDADILLYDDIKLDDPRLVIPHPRMLERAFVLIPLKDVNPGFMVGEKTLEDMIQECGDKDGVKLYKKMDNGVGFCG